MGGRARNINQGRVRCADCGKWKVLGAFGIDNSNPTGRRSYCKVCHNARVKASRAKNEQRSKRMYAGELPMPQGLNCNGCKKEKPPTDFFRKSTTRTGFSHRCKVCFMSEKKDWTERNKKRCLANPVSPTKRFKCSSCKETKLRDNFSQDFSQKRGYASWCRECVRKNRSEDSKLRHKLKPYGLTIEDFRTMLEGQGGVCLLCDSAGSEFKKGLCVDHCHDCGAVRGILCPDCNNANNFLKKGGMEWARRAHPYFFEKHECQMKKSAQQKQIQAVSPTGPLPVNR